MSGTKSADFQIRIAEKTHDPPIDCLKSEWPPHLYAFIKNRWPPYILPPPPPPLKFMNSPLGDPQPSPIRLYRLQLCL